MNWEALVVIGLFTLGLGVLLFVPAWIWVKRKQRSEPGKHPKLRLTRLGWVLIWITVVILIGGLMMDYIAPRSLLGRFVKVPGGRLIYMAIVAGVFWALEAALKTKGIKLIEDDKSAQNKRDTSQ